MKQLTCPRCEEPMRPTIREGIDVDVCPLCMGVWFDRGEVEKVFHRLTAVEIGDLPSTWDADLELAFTAVRS